MKAINTVRIAVAVAAAFFAGSALAQSQSDSMQSSSPAAAQDVGGSAMSTSAAGAPATLTHAQVYQDLVRSEQSGQQKALHDGIYHGTH